LWRLRTGSTQMVRRQAPAAGRLPLAGRLIAAM